MVSSYNRRPDPPLILTNVRWEGPGVAVVTLGLRSNRFGEMHFVHTFDLGGNPKGIQPHILKQHETLIFPYIDITKGTFCSTLFMGFEPLLH